MPNQALINAIQSLMQAVNDNSNILRALPPGGAGPAAGGQTTQLAQDQIDAMRSLTAILDKNAKQQKELFGEQARKFEQFGAAIAVMTVGIQQYQKYTVSRPYEALGGQQGILGRGMLERERDAGMMAGSVLALVSSLIHPALGAVVGAGVAAGRGIIGRVLFQEGSIRAAGEEMSAKLATERIVGVRDSMMLNYQMQRRDVAGAGMGGLGQTGMAPELTKMGFTAGEISELTAAVQSVGARGYGKFNIGRARAVTEMGIYGQDMMANMMALQTGNRIDFSEQELLGAARQTGFQLPRIARTAEMLRQRTYMYGSSAANQVFGAVMGTTMAGQIGPEAASMEYLRTSGAVQQAAGGGNEAQEMLLFQQFQRANPGSSYMDFLEAKSMGQNDPRWRKMMAVAARNFGAGGQQGRLLGVGLGIFRGAGVEAVGTSTQMLGQAVGEGVPEPLMTKKGQKEASIEMQKLGWSDYVQTMKQEALTISEFGGVIRTTSDRLAEISTTSKTLSESMKRSSELMEQYIASTGDVITRTLGTWDNALTAFQEKYGLLYGRPTSSNNKGKK